MAKNPIFHLFRVVLFAGLFAGTVGVGSAFAADLQQAKTQGLVGEQPNGYLGLVTSSAPADVKQLVADINRQRRASYENIAQRNKTSLQAVEALAGKKAIDKTSSGHYVKLPSGQWVKK